MFLHGFGGLPSLLRWAAVRVHQQILAYVTHVCDNDFKIAFDHPLGHFYLHMLLLSIIKFWWACPFACLNLCLGTCVSRIDVAMRFPKRDFIMCITTYAWRNDMPINFLIPPLRSFQRFLNVLESSSFLWMGPRIAFNVSNIKGFVKFPWKLSLMYERQLPRNFLEP